MKQIRKRDRDLIESVSKLPYDGFVYFMGNFRFGFVKIGYSKNPISRVPQLQTGCPFKIKLFFVLNCSQSVEGDLHEKFARHNTWGEWFKLNGELRKYVLKSMGLDEKFSRFSRKK